MKSVYNLEIAGLRGETRRKMKLNKYTVRSMQWVQSNFLKTPDNNSKDVDIDLKNNGMDNGELSFDHKKEELLAECEVSSRPRRYRVDHKMESLEKDLSLEVIVSIIYTAVGRK